MVCQVLTQPDIWAQHRVSLGEVCVFAFAFVCVCVCAVLSGSVWLNQGVKQGLD